MKNIFIFIFVFACCVASSIHAQNLYKFRVILSDKQNNLFTIENPQDFLSTKAIERRQRYNIALDSTDLPISNHYLAQISTEKCLITAKSKWLNSIVVSTQDSNEIKRINALPFVKATKLVYEKATTINYIRDAVEVVHKNRRNTNNAYGQSYDQLKMMNGIQLHDLGFKGEGMTIAVLDAGFTNVDKISAFKNTNLLGTKDFVDPSSDIFSTYDHGTRVFSVLAAVDSGNFIGSAPNASYWLLRSEDAYSEFPVEEDYWAMAAEYADSVGVDVITSSLGYYNFDKKEMNYTHSDLDGKTAFITQAANKVANKGILVINSAGNERQNKWNKIIFPSDSPNLLTVGAIDKNSVSAFFSGVGYTTDNRVKPDVVALGMPTTVIDINGNIIAAYGTSFSTPLIAGLATCLWQSLPQLNNFEIINLIRQNADMFAAPDSLKGYGVVDIHKAYQQIISSIAEQEPSETAKLKFIMKNNNLMLMLKYLPEETNDYMIQIYSSIGKLIFNKKFSGSVTLLPLKNMNKGIYIVNVQGERFRLSEKFLIN